MTSAKKTRVLVLGPTAPIRGGMASVVDALRESSLATDFDLTVLNTGKTTTENRSWAVAVRSQLRLLGSLSALLARGHGELVHVHTCSGPVFWRDSVLMLVARVFGRKTIWHIHGGGFDEFVAAMRGFRRSLLSAGFSLGHVVIVLSDSWRGRLSRHLNAARWAVVENGVPLPPARRRSPDAETVLFVGTLDRAKGADDLIAATAIASRSGFGGLVDMAGRETVPGQRARLEDLIEREGLGGRIRLLGLITGPDKVHAFETASMFVLPSHVEGLPVAMLEAMAYGLPVVATKVGAIPDVVTDGVHGFLIRPGDVDALAERMTRLWADATLRATMGAAARRRVEERYTVEAMASGVAEVYRTS